MSENKSFEKKLVAVGDSKCGKSAVLYMLAKEQYLEGYVPTLFENYAAEMGTSQGLVQVSMYDTPGDEDYSHMRPLSYPETDILLLCFDLSSPLSYQNIYTKWIPEIREYCPGVPFIIVGCKNDLTNSEMKTPEDYILFESPPTTPAEVLQLLTFTGAVDYCTCSAKYNHDLIGLFSKAVESTFQRKKYSFKKYRRKSASTSRITPRSPSMRRRTTIDGGKIRNSDPGCLPTFHRHRPVVREDYITSNCTCTIL